MRVSILRQRKTWRRPAKLRRGSLTPEQIENVRTALRTMHIRFRSWEAVAEVMHTTVKGIEPVIYGVRRPTAVHALRAAQAVGVPVDDVLTGAYPKAGSCPMCGRCV